ATSKFGLRLYMSFFNVRFTAFLPTIVRKLVSPPGPPISPFTREQFYPRARAAAFYDRIELFRFPAMIPPLTRYEIHLAASRRQCSSVSASRAKKKCFGNVAKIEADASPIGSPILPDFVPNDY